MSKNVFCFNNNLTSIEDSIKALVIYLLKYELTFTFYILTLCITFMFISVQLKMVLLRFFIEA